MQSEVNSPEPIEAVQYFIREDGTADVYLHKNIKEPEPETQAEGQEKSDTGTANQYTADEVYFMISTELASLEDIEADFDYWYEVGAGLEQSQYADRYSMTIMRQMKLEEVSGVCEMTIYAGIDVEISDGVHHFSLTDKDQTNLFGCQLKIAAGLPKIEYHSDGNPCKYYTVEDMSKIVNQALFFVGYCTTYCNALNMWIRGGAKPSDIVNIKWGAEIPTEYHNEVLDDYLSKMVGGA